MVCFFGENHTPLQRNHMAAIPKKAKIKILEKKLVKYFRLTKSWLNQVGETIEGSLTKVLHKSLVNYLSLPIYPAFHAPNLNIIKDKLDCTLA